MKHLLTALLALSVFLGTGDVSLAAKKESKIVVSTPDPVKDATVNLYCRLKVGKTIYATSGSGVFISKNGIILTNAHVAQDFLLPGSDKRIDGWCSVRTGSPAKEHYTAKVLYLPPAWITDNAAQLAKGKPRGTGENDFALLYVTGAEKSYALPLSFPSVSPNVAATYLENEGVTVSGYPNNDLSFSGVRNKLPLAIASSTVTAVRSLTSAKTADVFTIASSSVGNFGASGGPVVANGSLIGIITSKGSNEEDRTLRAITIPYVNTLLLVQTGMSLQTLAAGTPSALAPTLTSGITADLVKILSGALIKKK